MSQLSQVAVVILAAGQGTRMRSDIHKVLHPIASRPLLLHLLDCVESIGAGKRVVVVGKGRDQLEQALEGHDLTLAHQAEQKGTGHAVLQASDALAGHDGAVLILYGDTPFVQAATLTRMLDRLDGDDRPGIVVLASKPADPAAYGRIVLGKSDHITKMVEYRDSTAEERGIELCNSGMMAVRGADLFRWLGKLGNDNVAGEYYLPDIVAIAASEGRHAVVIEGDEFETAGVNSRAELAHLELDWQRRRREQALGEGATLIDPESVWFSFDTRLGRDVTVEPHVVFGPGVEIADGASIKAFSHVEGARIGARSSIGPFARIRPGSVLAEDTKIGNFVEIKKTSLAAGAKVNHLSYVGDCEVGKAANIGAGTITCNYDGFGKHRTTIGAGAFIGSNSSLVAPVRIGERAVVGAGSVITQDVDPDSLALERNPQRSIAGWARKFRERMSKKA